MKKEVEAKPTANAPGLNIDGVVRSFFGHKYYYLDPNTRISFGWHLSTLGKSYLLQRKRKYFWIETAWSYILPFHNPTLEGLIKYFYWYENEHKTEKQECIF